ncbi:MAG: hypothetical protein H7Y03_08430 [Chitinophagaceae bacterium]|nr:hypothetical protein [Chitinophagaceae bacterium]
MEIALLMLSLCYQYNIIMAITKVPAKTKEDFRRVIRKEIKHQLENSLTDLKAVLGEKKFENRVKKAAKALSAGIRLKSKLKSEEKNVKNVSEKKVKIAAVEAAQ